MFSRTDLDIQTVERRGDKATAYTLFDQAVRLAPDNALVRYRRAKMLISMKRYKVSWRLGSKEIFVD
jgi:predicted Zn-dependent protease